MSKQIKFVVNTADLKMIRLNRTLFADAALSAAAEASSFDERTDIRMAGRTVGYAQAEEAAPPAAKKSAKPAGHAPATNKDGSPRKKSGPSPGFKRGQKITGPQAEVPRASDPDPRPHEGPSTPAPGTTEAEKLEQSPRTQHPVSQPAEQTASEVEASVPPDEDQQ